MTIDPRITAAAQGNEAAMNSLFASYEGLMQKAARQSHLAPIAEDALAEARLSFLEAVKSYDAALGVPFAGYAKAKVYGDLRTLFKQSRRQWQREVLPDGSADDDGAGFWDSLADPNDAVASLDDVDAVAAALLALPERQQELIRLLYVRELTQKAAAAELGITQQAAAAMKARAIKKLKEVLTR